VNMKIKREGLHDIITLLIIFLVGSCVVINDVISSFATIFLWMLAFLLICLNAKKLNIKTLFIGAVLIACILASSIVNGEILKNTVSRIVSIVIIIFYVASIDFDEAKESVVRVMTFLAGISLILFTACLFISPLSNVMNFQVRQNTFANFGLFVYEVGMSRNCGMFWEPGAYQSFLNLAILLEILKPQINKNRIIILVLAVLSTFSTTGYIALFTIAIIFVFRLQDLNKKIKYITIGICLIFIGLCLLGDKILVLGENNLFGKIMYFFYNKDYHYQSGKNLTSAAIRYFSIVKPAEIFVQNPLFGVGYQNVYMQTYSYTSGVISCTFVNWFAMYGGLLGLIMIVGYAKVSKKSNKSFMVTCLIFIVLMMIIMSEDYSNNAFYYAIALYGYKSSGIQRKID